MRANRIFVVADVLVGIAAALDHSVPAGAPVIVPTPAYPPFFEVVRQGGRPVVEAPAVIDGDRFTLDLDRIEAGLASGAGAVLLCNPHNPIGRAYEPAELQALAALVDRHGARVVADELHAPLVHAGHRHTPYSSVSDAAEHSITVTSASKAWNIPGLKCAQVITTNHTDATVWRNLGVFAVPGPTPIGIAASTAAYAAGDAWRTDLLDHLGRNRRLLTHLLTDELPGVGLRPPDATYLAWLDCAALGLDDPAAFFLEHARVAVSDGPPFGTGFDQCVRFNFATSSVILERMLRAMGDAVRSRRS